MARIRTIKPEFFRHEGLQDLASEHGAHVMLVFAGLWGHCDKAGRFEWRPRQLKLDILPFLNFDMAETLEILEAGGMVKRYEAGGKMYGVIDSFPEHQRLSGKESQEPEKYPAPPGKQQGSNGEATGKQQGSNGEATGKQQGSNGDGQESQEGKGREEEGNGVNPAPKPARFDPASMPLPPGIPPDKWAGWIAYRRHRRLSTSETTARKQLEFLTQCLARGQPPGDVIDASVRNGWQGLFELKQGNGYDRQQHLAAVAAELTGRNRTAHDPRVIEGVAVAVD